MSSSDKNIVDDFRQICLIDLRNKKIKLALLQEEEVKSIQAQCESKAEQIAKVLVLLQDQMVSCLRQKFKQIVEFQKIKMEEEFLHLKQVLMEKIYWQNDHLDRIISTIESEGVGCNKMLAKIASGKIQQEIKQFNEEVHMLRISECTLSFEKQQIAQLVQQIIDLLHVQLPRIAEDSFQSGQKSKSIPNKSQITQKNISRAFTQQQVINNNSKISLRSQNRSAHTLMRNESAVSVQIEQAGQIQQIEQMEKQAVAEGKNDQAIEEYKETKTIRKAKKLEQKLKQRELSPEKDVHHLMKLALERKRLLKDLQ